MREGDVVAIERVDGYATTGEFYTEDGQFVTVIGLVGDNIGKEILVPIANIAQIVVVKAKQRGESKDRIEVN